MSYSRESDFGLISEEVKQSSLPFSCQIRELQWITVDLGSSSFTAEVKKQEWRVVNTYCKYSLPSKASNIHSGLSVNPGVYSPKSSRLCPRLSPLELIAATAVCQSMRTGSHAVPKHQCLSPSSGLLAQLTAQKTILLPWNLHLKVTPSDTNITNAAMWWKLAELEPGRKLNASCHSKQPQPQLCLTLIQTSQLYKKRTQLCIIFL